MENQASPVNRLILLPQERGIGCQFDSHICMTRTFQHAFGKMASFLAITAVSQIRQERVATSAGADFLQVLEYEHTRFWVIDDGEVVTILMPEDY